MLYFGSSFISIAIADPNTEMSKKVGCSIFAPVALNLGAETLAVFEINAVTMDFNTIDYEYNNYSLSLCLGMMIVSFLAFLLLGLYLENVLPS